MRQVLLPFPETYLVGGAVRDLLSGRGVHDFDFVLKQDTVKAGRAVARALDAPLFVLDDERQTVRVILQQPDALPFYIDFAVFQGETLEDDLRLRDYSLNAMALPVTDLAALRDPCGGLADLRSKKLRACSPTALTSDPIRVLRGVRMAMAYNLSILPETAALMRLAAPLLSAASAERRRDELFKIFNLPRVITAVRLMDQLGLVMQVFPDLETLKHTPQSPPHVFDVWEHTLHTLESLEDLLNILTAPPDQENGGSLILGLASMCLGRFRQPLAEHLRQEICPGRPARWLLLLSALYHDAGKPATRTQGADGRHHAYGHEVHSARAAFSLGEGLALANAETARIELTTRNHMRLHHLAWRGEHASRRAIYRYFRDNGEAGLDICLLSLADTLATYHTTLPVATWEHELELVRSMFEAWWERPEECVRPRPLVNGKDLIEAFSLTPGPLVGRVLESLREAQATGHITTREQALEHARHTIQEMEHKDHREAIS